MRTDEDDEVDVRWMMCMMMDVDVDEWQGGPADSVLGHVLGHVGHNAATCGAQCGQLVAWYGT